MSVYDYSGKVVIITGSSSGIGQATAVLFAKSGAFVTIHGRSEDGLKKTKDLILEAGIAEDKVHAVKGSIVDSNVQRALIDETYKTFGRIDVLINNAGGMKSDETDQRSMTVLNYALDVHVKAPIALTELVIPYLEKTKGNIVNISGIGAQMPIPTFPYYSIARAAEDHFTRNYAAILAPKGIRINNINPGLVDTPILSQIQMPSEMLKKLSKFYISQIPLGRIARAEEIASFLAFVASEKASYMTGQCIIVDGGSLIHSQPFKFD
uniref:Uncharacterized protein n=1 Tax=Panagrolaimus sp. ES5 TaxID=591445 RepID=A0AC34FSF6_9BILA